MLAIHHHHHHHHHYHHYHRLLQLIMEEFRGPDDTISFCLMMIQLTNQNFNNSRKSTDTTHHDLDFLILLSFFFGVARHTNFVFCAHRSVGRTATGERLLDTLLHTQFSQQQARASSNNKPSCQQGTRPRMRFSGSTYICKDAKKAERGFLFISCLSCTPFSFFSCPVDFFLHMGRSDRVRHEEGGGRASKSKASRASKQVWDGHQRERTELTSYYFIFLLFPLLFE